MTGRSSGDGRKGFADPRLVVLMLTAAAALLAAALVYSVGQLQRSPAVSPPVSLGQAPVFLLTDQNGEPFHSSDLQGKVWVADFFFTSCRSICPRLLEQMLRLQDEFAGAEDLRLVSITVDPERDTPEVLLRYAIESGADTTRWTFLTGDKRYVHDLIRRGFLSPVEPQDDAAMPILHSPRFVLVDRAGFLRGFFDALDPPEMEELIRETKAVLAEKKPLP
jgi:protein SCO1/2